MNKTHPSLTSKGLWSSAVYLSVSGRTTGLCRSGQSEGRDVRHHLFLPGGAGSPPVVHVVSVHHTEENFTRVFRARVRTSMMSASFLATFQNFQVKLELM